jgi:hypothetical protein
MRLVLTIGLVFALVSLGFRPNGAHAMDGFAQAMPNGPVMVDCQHMAGHDMADHDMDHDMDHGAQGMAHNTDEGDVSSDDMGCLCSLGCMMLCGVAVVYLPTAMAVAISQLPIHQEQFTYFSLASRGANAPPFRPPRLPISV